jgi:uncharacterized membrane-anchored protein
VSSSPETTRPSIDARLDPLKRGLAKVPEVTVWFWITKILTTGMGETTSDFMNGWMGPAIAVPIMLVALWLALRLQLRRPRYEAWSYWLVVVVVAIFGTTAADALHVVLGIPYVISTAFYLVVLALIFIWWYRSEGTLSIHSIYTRRRERFYWATVLATFALGTAAGDMTATPLHLGYLASGLMFAVLFAVPGLAYWRLGLNEIAAFWIAYIVTRPLGASFADWGAVTPNKGGLGFGPGWISLVLALMIVLVVWFLSATRKDVREDVAAKQRPVEAGTGGFAIDPVAQLLPAEEPRD